MAELVWEGKYDKEGRKAAPLRVALPFQTVETVNESAQERQMALEAWTHGRTTEWRNRLVWGDKKYVLPSLLPEFAGKVDLIYIDPPFATGADFSYDVQIDGESFTREPSLIEQKAFRDTWGRNLDSYLHWFYETVVLLRELLVEGGSIYVHLDWHLGHYAKTVLDEICGREHFRNQIVWTYGGSGRGAKAIAGQFPRNHDILLWFSKGDRAIYNVQRTPRRVHVNEASRSGYRQDQDGRWFKTAPRGDYTDVSIAELEKENRIHTTTTGNIRIKYFLRQEGSYVVEDVMLGDTWADIPDAMHLSEDEKTDYPTQKPEALLARILQASSTEGDLVLDCFVGSGTTAAVAEKLGRRWIACDLSRFAIHTTRKRLLGLPNVKPFVVQNLGKYERQIWQKAEFGEAAEARARDYREFVLKLYHATPITGYAWLHGVKAGRMVHVGAVDSPVSLGDVTQIASEFRRVMGTGKDAPRSTGVDVLGWDFAFEMNEVAKQHAEQANIHLRFLRIPRDVMDKRAVEQGDVQFFELAALSVDVTVKGRTVAVKLTDFVIPPDEVPEEVQRAIKRWQQWVDYWAVDWDNKGDTFHNQWQSYRTRKERDLQMSASHTYDKAGEYAVVVKVIDILGNDTTKTVKVVVR